MDPKKPLIIAGITLAAALLPARYATTQEPPQPLPQKSEEFCGRSTSGKCSTDADCVKDGCSGQVCRSKYEEPVITTCEWRQCYDAAAYRLTCGCVNEQCRWLQP